MPASEWCQDLRNPLTEAQFSAVTRQDSFGVGAGDGAQFLCAKYFTCGYPPDAIYRCSEPVIGAVENPGNGYNLAIRAEGDLVGRRYPKVATKLLALTSGEGG